MELDRRACDRARRARDARFDGRFFIAVTTTRIYCRPICPARGPKDEHIRYYHTAAAAEAAGYRPCLRCRPEAAPGSPAWRGTSTVVGRALRLIGDGALDSDSVDQLADRLGVTGRHLRRLFVQHVGASPIDVTLTRRVHFAKRLIDTTPLAFRSIAIAAGFGSLRRFNGQMRRIYSRTPTELRRLSQRSARNRPEPTAGYQLRLTARMPYDWAAAMAFLQARATPGVEHVDGLRYRRTIAVGDHAGTIDVSPTPTGDGLRLDVRIPEPRALLAIVERVRRMFDLDADPPVIEMHLRGDALLRRALAKHPGIRVIGAWDGFEIAVRAILGQQVSVAAATTIAGRIAARFGSPFADDGPLVRLFPTAAQLADAALEDVGVLPSRAQTIRTLARHAASGALTLDGTADRDATVNALVALPGIGPWTAEYIAMRALGDPDAFPTGDRVLMQMTGDRTAGALTARAESWRPWRSYALMLLWHEAGAPGRARANAIARHARAS